jgi:undecaprenyl-diphosphatase
VIVEVLCSSSSSMGAAVWTGVTKNIIERVRPAVLPHLIEVSGFSYPSGHTLVASSVYLTIAIIACDDIRSALAGIAILAMTGVIIVRVVALTSRADRILRASDDGDPFGG